MAMEAVLSYVCKAPGRLVIVRSSDAPKIQMAAKMNGATLPLLAIRAAIEKLTHA